MLVAFGAAGWRTGMDGHMHVLCLMTSPRTNKAKAPSSRIDACRKALLVVVDGTAAGTLTLDGLLAAVTEDLDYMPKTSSRLRILA